MVETKSHQDKILDITEYFKDAFGNEEDLYSRYRKYANDFLKYMRSRGWDIVDYDERNHNYYPKSNKKAVKS